MIKKSAVEEIEIAEERPMLNRRDMIKGAAVAAVGAIAAVAVPGIAAANTGDAVLCGTPAVSSTGAAALQGEAASNDAVRGLSTAANLTGVYGENWSGNGVKGSGVTGVWGYSVAGDGVRGESTHAGVSGVYALNNVVGGYAVFARSTGGTALRVEGTASFKRSGVATVAKKKAYVTITVPDGGLKASSKFLVTMQKYAGAGVYVQYSAYRNATTFRVYFNKKTIKATSIAWMVVD